MNKKPITMFPVVLVLVFILCAGGGTALSAGLEEIGFTPDSNGIIFLSEEQSRRYFGIEDNGYYIPIPHTEYQILASEDFRVSGANGQENHVMTVSLSSQDDRILQAQIYATPESRPAESATEVLMINGNLWTGARYEQNGMIIREIWGNLNGKHCSVTGCANLDESDLAALFGLISHKGFAGNLAGPARTESAAAGGKTGTAAAAGETSALSGDNRTQEADGNVLATVEFEISPYEKGFLVPVPVGKCNAGEWKASITGLQDNKTGSMLTTNLTYHTESPGSDGSAIIISYSVVHEAGRVSRTAQKLRLEKIRQDYQEYLGDLLRDLDYTDVEIDDHPALILLGRGTGKNGAYLGTIHYIRNDECLSINITARASAGSLTMDDMISVARMIAFDESLADFRESQVSPVISSENNDYTASAGQKIKLTAAFGDPDFVKAEGRNKISWYVGSSIAEETGLLYPTEDAAISGKGVLTVSNHIDEPKTVFVVARSDSYQTYDVKEFLLLPKVTKVLAEPDTISLFAAEGQEAKAAVSLEPASVPVKDLVWTASAKNIAELEDHGDGSVTIRPLKAGKTVFTVKERGGKTGKVTVVVKQPVESLELSAKGNAVPGKAVTVSAKISPSNATDKNLTWTLDVDESIATVTGKGQVKVGKGTPAGTVITVSCTAEGAVEPVTATYQLEVADK